jgi:GT2 family glycosyltransferase
MPDTSPRLPRQPGDQTLTTALPEQSVPDFDEANYLRAYPDVAAAIQRGELASGLEHYLLAGKAERRLELPQYRLVAAPQPAGPASKSAADPRGGTARARGPGAGVDTMMVSESGAVFISGWTDDRQNPMVAMNLRIGRTARHSWTSFPRMRRRDVEESLRFAGSYQHGFWVFAGSDDRPGPRPSPREAGCVLELCYSDGAAAELNRVPVTVTDTELRDIVMRYFAACEYLGNPAVEACISLDGGAGDAFIAFNRSISRGFASQALVEQFGPTQRKPKVSVIVPLYGIGDYLFLQSSLYAPQMDSNGNNNGGNKGRDQAHDIAAYEFIYVVNSPELIDRLHRELRIAQMIYGLTQTLVTLPGNAGFGVANNIAARLARSDRLLFLNPDVFPCDPGWARRHLDVLANLPPEQTRLFGSSLYYADGSLMHGGMYFEVDACFHPTPEGMTRRSMIRVENYGKGAPPWASQYVASRAVPAVSRAFLSIDRVWFEKLGRFTEHYIFDHYEDADLCLKSLRQGFPAWLHDIRMWHLEGKGSRRSAQHEGGSLVNRWHFARTWIPTIDPGLLGPGAQDRLMRLDNDTPTVQENQRDLRASGEAPVGRARQRATKQRATKPNGMPPAARLKQQAVKSGGAAPTRQRITKPNDTLAIGVLRQRPTKPNGPAPTAQAKPNGTTPTARTKSNGTAPTAQAKPRAARPHDAAPIGPTKQRALKPNSAAPPAHMAQRGTKAAPPPAPARPAARRPR